jgi:hypothetical protein
MQRQREKDEKKARKQEEKERQKSRSRTRIDEQNPNSRSNNRSKARIVLLDDTDEYVDLGVRNTKLKHDINIIRFFFHCRKMIREKYYIYVYVN